MDPVAAHLDRLAAHDRRLVAFVACLSCAVGVGVTVWASLTLYLYLTSH